MRGGYRPGGGRPKGSKTVRVAQDAREGATPLDYLLSIVNDPEADPARRDRAAIAALPFVHPRADAGGKKARAALEAGTAERGTAWDELLNVPDLYRPRQVRAFGDE